MKQPLGDKVLFSPEVIRKSQDLPEPEQTSPTGWRIASRSSKWTNGVPVYRFVHTDASGATGKLTYANCSCPAGEKGRRENAGQIGTCGHVFKVLMAIAGGIDEDSED